MAAHAEQNALAHGDGTRFTQSTLYVNMAPCFACARQMAGAGIRRIVYLQRGDRVCDAVTVNFLDSAQVKVEVVDDLSNYPV
jgi:deoxycytidylate deaminase